MAEYAVILAVITLVVVVAITALSGGIESALDKVTALLNGAGG
jgi:Flp pilus assembly pilin Flp